MRKTARPWYGRSWAVALLIGLVLVATGLLTYKALGFRTVEVDAEPLPQASSGFNYTWWNGALGRWVRDGGVDYGAVRAQEGDLLRFAATLGTLGPRTSPERFTTEPARLAYYLNAYNALAIQGILDGRSRAQAAAIRAAVGEERFLAQACNLPVSPMR